jgi:Aldo/keto reductase family
VPRRVRIMTPAGDGSFPLVMLDGGVAMPRIGYGVLRIQPATFEQAIRAALDAGYRSIDTATMYGTEALLGQALERSGRRDEVFLTTKLSNPDHGYAAACAAFERSRAALQVDVIDLYLIHWPIPRRNLYVETWQALIELRERGHVRAIGVSNFAPEHIARLIAETGVVPAINQIECPGCLEAAPPLWRGPACRAVGCCPRAVLHRDPRRCRTRRPGHKPMAPGAGTPRHLPGRAGMAACPGLPDLLRSPCPADGRIPRRSLRTHTDPA